MRLAGMATISLCPRLRSVETRRAMERPGRDEGNFKTASGQNNNIQVKQFFHTNMKIKA